MTFLPTKPKIHSHQTMQNCVKIYRYYNIRVNYISIIHVIFSFYSFFTYAKDEGRKWMVVVICEERETKKKKKSRKINILKKYSVK